MISSPLKENTVIEWYKSHTFSLHFSLPSFLLALIIPKASQEQECPRSWDFKHQKIPALWTPCLLLLPNAMTYMELSQAREEWRSGHGLVGGSVFSALSEEPLMQWLAWQGLSLWSLRRVTPVSSYFGFCSHKSHLRGHRLAASQSRHLCDSSLKSWFVIVQTFWLFHVHVKRKRCAPDRKQPLPVTDNPENSRATLQPVLLLRPWNKDGE